MNREGGVVNREDGVGMENGSVTRRQDAWMQTLSRWFEAGEPWDLGTQGTEVDLQGGEGRRMTVLPDEADWSCAGVDASREAAGRTGNLTPKM